MNVSSTSGKTYSTREDMRLYSGYVVSTEEASYAWITLDAEKAVKLDECSSLEVRRSGKSLELLLKSGEMYCDVTAPLKEDEKLNIRKLGHGFQQWEDMRGDGGFRHVYVRHPRNSGIPAGGDFDDIPHSYAQVGPVAVLAATEARAHFVFELDIDNHDSAPFCDYSVHSGISQGSSRLMHSSQPTISLSMVFL